MRNQNTRITREITFKKNVTVPFSTRLCDEFVKLRCAGDIIRLYPNVKEITESMSVFHALHKVEGLGIPEVFGDESVVCIVPGDGVSPRTGALVACRTRWTVYSIDPLLRFKGKDVRVGIREVKRLNCIAEKIEDVEEIEGGELGIVLAVHSHAPLDIAVNKLKCRRVIVVSLPCCVEQNVDHGGMWLKPIKDYRDAGVFSPKNRILIWDVKTRQEDGV